MHFKAAIPTNIITGFLGVGKTTAISYLLKHKPADETWAVLVNEFGEVGIDGALLGANKQKVVIREVAGGCMCCASGLPMQIALNMLIARSKPDRLLIEPTGLGHPAEVLAALSSEHYRGVLSLRATLTLVDARKVKEQRYREHDIFRQQLQVADRILANKADLYEEYDVPVLESFLCHLGLGTKIDTVQHGQIDPAWLDAESAYRTSLVQTGREIQGQDTGPLPTPQSGFVRKENQGDGFSSCGWVFAAGHCFVAHKLTSLLMGLEMDRVKAIMFTERGWILFNKADGILTSSELNEAPDSRMECISSMPQDWTALESALLSTRYEADLIASKEKKEL